MNAADALRFVEKHGVVLESARHASVPSLAEALAGAPIRGSWWSHPKGREIFAATRAVREAPEVLVCRIVDGKVSFAHERIWPALVRLSHAFANKNLARVRETHTERGTHRVENIAFPKWVPASTSAAAERMSEADARAALGALLPGVGDG
jgi:hypothetical protein